MLKLKFVKFLAVFVMIVGMLVMVGWFLDIGWLKSILPNLIAMKFTTALCFVASGIVLYAVAEEHPARSFVFQAILPSAILLIWLLMITLFITAVFGVETNLDNIFVQEKIGAISTFILGRPSIPTMVNFILIAIVGILAMAGLKKHIFWLGTMVSLIGGLAVIGYIFNQPIFYYLVVSLNNPMALNTAFLFVLIGIGFILCGKTALKQN